MRSKNTLSNLKANSELVTNAGKCTSHRNVRIAAVKSDPQQMLPKDVVTAYRKDFIKEFEGIDDGS